MFRVALPGKGTSRQHHIQKVSIQTLTLPKYRTDMTEGCTGAALEEAVTAARVATWPERRDAAVRAAAENMVNERFRVGKLCFVFQGVWWR